MNYKVFLILLLGVGIHLTATGQSAHSSLRAGDAAYRAESWEEAQAHYLKADASKPSFKAKFNSGNAMYQQEKYQESSEEYMAALSRSDDPMEKSATFYNLGNALFQSGDLPRAIDAYKQSLRLNPKDIQAKTNLTRALQQQQQQQQKQQQDKDKEKEQQDESKENDPQQNGDQEGKDQSNNNQSPSNNSPQNQGNPGQPQGKQGQPAQPKHMTRQESEELLRIMKDEEQKVRAKVMQGRDQRRPGSDKDW